MNKLISSKIIIGNVNRMFGGSIANSKYDIVEFVGEAIELIGYHTGFINKIKKEKVLDYTIDLPCDFIHLNHIFYNGKVMTSNQHDRICNNGNFHSEEFDDLIQFLHREETKDESCDFEQIEISKERELNKLQSLFYNLHLSGHKENHYYYLEGFNCFKTNLENDKIVYINYKAFPVDNDGFPLILDEINYKKGIEYYCVMRLIEMGFQHPTFNYQTIVSMSNNYIAKATNQNLKMTEKQMIDFSNKWTNLKYNIKDGFNQRTSW